MGDAGIASPATTFERVDQNLACRALSELCTNVDLFRVPDLTRSDCCDESLDRARLFVVQTCSGSLAVPMNRVQRRRIQQFTGHQRVARQDGEADQHSTRNPGAFVIQFSAARMTDRLSDAD